MSPENVEVVRRAIDRNNETGDVPWETIDKDVEWVMDPAAFTVGTDGPERALEAVGLPE